MNPVQNGTINETYIQPYAINNKNIHTHINSYMLCYCERLLRSHIQYYTTQSQYTVLKSRKSQGTEKINLYN